MAKDEPVSTLFYKVHPDGFGAPMDVSLNGEPLKGVLKITTEQGDGEFAVATIRLGGVRVNVITKEG